ncbi:mitochondrial protein Pet127-domain-containing protein [Nemania sp. FL0031]|nr:mitochondrial protein Pet127-domain-containing protein [Nemania sp. FL0031]
MLQLGRHGLCRLTNPYVCASCLATPYSASIVARRRAVAPHYGRPFSTTIAWREAATPAAPTETANAPASADVVSDTAEPPPAKKNKKKKKPSQASSTASPSSSKTQPETDAQRQLKVLQGALSALQNVLTTQGVDVSQIPTTKASTTPPTEPTTKAKAKTKAKTKAKPKPKAKAAKKGDKSLKAATARDATAQDAIIQDTPSKEVDSESTAPDTEAAGPETRPKKDGASTKTEQRSKPKPRKSRVQPAKARRAAERGNKLENKPKTAKPANLGVPFSGENFSSAKSASKAGKLPDKVHPGELSLNPIDTVRPAVPSLSYGLERVLFNPGVYQLQDPRSRVYNFDPYLSEIMPVNEFDFNALKEYVTSSKDSTLISIAKEHGKKYTGSTSSMTSMLAHFHFLLSAWRDINASMLSRSFVPDSMRFTRIMRAPAAIFLHWKDGTYAIDADKEFDTANILSMLGKSMEKLLTLSKDEYERYRHGNSDQITEEERNAEEAFHYTGFQDFMMRSQLDAYDQRMPGTGMFDLKTRAVISIRMDAKGYHKGLGYEIRNRFGQWESFEREYYDMIRSAFLKYSLQVRMGRMDGIFVAFHNTQRIFGFQYIPLTEMDLSLHGSDNRLIGDQEFKVSLKLLNELLNRATEKWPEQSLRLHVETRTSEAAPFMYFFAEPTTPEEIAAVQNAGKASIEAFERDILGLVRNTAEGGVDQPDTDVEDVDGQSSDRVVPLSTPAQEIDSFAAWQEARQMVEEAMGDDEGGVGLVREAIADALEQSGIIHVRSQAESSEYVNALLGALIGRTQSAQAGEATIHPSEETTIGEDELEEQATDRTQEELDQSIRSETLHSESDAATLHSDVNQGTETKDTEGVRSDIPTSSLEPAVTSTPPLDNPHSEQSVIDTRLQSPSTQTTPSDMEYGSITTAEGDIDETATATESHAGERKDLEESFEEEEEEDDYEEAGEVEVEAKESNEDGASTNLEPLKSLIMRMARRVDEGPVSATDIDTPRDDASKLREFERILGRLISQSKMEQPEEASGDDTQDRDLSLESTHPSGSSIVDSQSEVASTPDAQGEEAPQPAAAEEPQPDPEAKEPELLAFTLTIKNRVNGAYVHRPNNLQKDDDWTVEYEIQEVKQPRAQRIYAQLKERRRKIFEDTGDKEAEWYKMFQGNLHEFTQKGRAFREQEKRRVEGQPVYMVGTDGPLEWRDVFRRQPKDLQTPDEESSDSQT